MSMNDGGPAFPTAWESIHGGTGMTLRQWYAGQALIGLVIRDEITGRGESWVAGYAKDALEIADAVLAAEAAEEKS